MIAAAFPDVPSHHALLIFLAINIPVVLLYIHRLFKSDSANSRIIILLTGIGLVSALNLLIFGLDEGLSITAITKRIALIVLIFAVNFYGAFLALTFLPNRRRVVNAVGIILTVMSPFVLFVLGVCAVETAI